MSRFSSLIPRAWCALAGSLISFAVAARALAAPGAPALNAHAELLSSYPAPGAVVAGTPAEIRLTFNERIGLGSALQLFGPAFRAVPGVTAGVDPAAPQLLRAIPPPLAPDTYTVEWTAVSADGHGVSGSFAFSVGTSATAGASPSGPVWPVIVAAIVAATLIAAALGYAAWRISRARRGAATPSARAWPGSKN